MSIPETWSWGSWYGRDCKEMVWRCEGLINSSSTPTIANPRNLLLPAARSYTSNKISEVWPVMSLERLLHITSYVTCTLITTITQPCDVKVGDYGKYGLRTLKLIFNKLKWVPLPRSRNVKMIRNRAYIIKNIAFLYIWKRCDRIMKQYLWHLDLFDKKHTNFKNSLQRYKSWL